MGKKVGKPPIIITDEMIDKAEAMAARGLTMEQIASCLGIGSTTLYNKCNQYPKFDEAIKHGRDKGISIVANALFENAKAGDKVAQIFYLKCRAGWKETSVTQIEHSVHEKWLDELK